MRAKEYCLTVQGSTVFPIDMLVYDRCCPATKEDAAKIIASHQHETPKDGWTVTVILLLSGPPRFTELQWNHYGWRVMKAEFKEV